MTITSEAPAAADVDADDDGADDHAYDDDLADDDNHVTDHHDVDNHDHHHNDHDQHDPVDDDVLGQRPVRARAGADPGAQPGPPAAAGVPGARVSAGTLGLVAHWIDEQQWAVRVRPGRR